VPPGQGHGLEDSNNGKFSDDDADDDSNIEMWHQRSIAMSPVNGPIVV